MQSLISIIIPTYNRVHYLGETLDSILGQSYKNWECLVVDDGSEDHTAELVSFYQEKDSRIRYYHRPKDRAKGANSCRNYGFENSNGIYINWFDDDDIMLPNFLAKRIHSFSTRIEFVISPGFYVDERLCKEKVMHINPDFTLFKGIIFWHQQIITNSVLFRKSFLENRNLFREGLPKSQEMEFFTRVFFGVSNKNYQIQKEPLFLYRQHPESKTSLGKSYNSEFKKAEADIDMANLERSVQIKDGPLIKFLLNRLIGIFEEASIAKDEEMRTYIIRELNRILSGINRSTYFKFKFLLFLQELTSGKYSFLRRNINIIVVGLNETLKRKESL